MDPTAIRNQLKKAGKRRITSIHGVNNTIATTTITTTHALPSKSSHKSINKPLRERATISVSSMLSSFRGQPVRDGVTTLFVMLHRLISVCTVHSQVTIMKEVGSPSSHAGGLV
mmetsp:Transcript_7498/g.12256  ORF Transcript_7498/g.12256 Transcript_7498/m.12256 type:complete len:114 (-) Transcript_7498:28-369(-)